METIQQNETTMPYYSQSPHAMLSSFVTLGDDDETRDILQELMFRKPLTIRVPTPLLTLAREKDLSCILEEDE
ncbi:hypothetical protein SPRG_12577 [Saprolegnia parasitica CBS 223.65]|uniref:Uncharacterized protein n=1 Tax=Saprolegnia parasitica (strain CBS 223.65) TaxID=695850 RepID=A0A067C724_SAPPC|nr:hypothetical protein SPRG_12577 [Saprolegnia parasitica CBS 223.65]KDO22597.1 hypothetical protein SPRG_12577 [Saprolegnia parasitica CBS 223.65]|eukprot:XP_012206713.1 hypothetical protein SPRG_12577 [Saprolegnia parasitica CBS 223.65]